MAWFQKKSQDVLKEQKVELSDGLSADEAARRLQEYGSNQLESGRKINPVALFFGQFCAWINNLQSCRYQVCDIYTALFPHADIQIDKQI